MESGRSTVSISGLTNTKSGFSGPGWKNVRDIYYSNLRKLATTSGWSGSKYLNPGPWERMGAGGMVWDSLSKQKLLNYFPVWLERKWPSFTMVCLSKLSGLCAYICPVFVHTFVYVCAFCVGVHCWNNWENGHLIGFAESTHFDEDKQISLSAYVKDDRAEMELHLFNSTVIHAEAKQLRYRWVIPASKTIGLSAGKKILAEFSWQLWRDFIVCQAQNLWKVLSLWLPKQIKIS